MKLRKRKQPDAVTAPPLVRMPFDEYLARPEDSFHSLLKLNPPALYNAWRLGLIPETKTKAMETGTLLHTLVLEGREDWVEQPSHYLNEKGERKPWNWNAGPCREFAAQHENDSILSAAEAGALRSMRDACWKLMPPDQGATIEHCGFAEINGVKMKCRPDRVGQGRVVDLKSTSNLDQFEREIATRRYHCQAALYLRILEQLGLGKMEFWILAVETKAPYLACYRRLDPMAITAGNQWIDRQLATLTQCRLSGEWPGYESGTVEWRVPDWSLMQDFGELELGGEAV
jgi:hypothetical protein